MAKADFISVERLRQMMSYDEETGIFTWKRSVRRRTNKLGNVGYTCKNGYVQIAFDGIITRAHRLAWLYVYGVHPSGSIDHINGIRNDNRISNLRDVSHAVNMQNRHGPATNNVLSVAGVTKCRSGYRAEICVNSKRYHLGVYNTVLEAGAAYNAGKMILHKKASESHKTMV